MRLWQTDGGRPLAVLQGHSGIVWGVALSADGRMVASGGEDGTVHLWETASQRLLMTLRGHGGAVFRVALSADGQLLTSSGMDGTLRVWPTGSTVARVTVQAHTGAVWGMALSADGRLMASGGRDGAVGVWEAQGGAVVRTLRPDRPYERLDMTDLSGVTDAQKAALATLGAVERHAVPESMPTTSIMT